MKKNGSYVYVSTKLKTNSGFTLIEIVVVLIVMGIITAFAIGRGFTNMPNLSVQTDVIKSHLRHAQARAMNSNTFWGIRTDAGGDSYWMFRCDSSDCTDIIRLPGENANTVALSAAGISLDPGTYAFDDRGIPYYADHNLDPNPSDLLVSDRMITVSRAGADNITIIITKRTGFIP